MRIFPYTFVACAVAVSLTLVGCGGPNINAAARQGKAEKITEALEQGADVNQRGQNGNTPLHFATWEGHVECIRVLLAHGANVDAVNTDGPHTPLHFAATFGRTEIAGLLIEAGANVDARDKHQLTPLHFAAGKDHPEVAALLLEKGADPKAKSKKRGDTPLDTARRSGNERVARVLQAASGR